MLVLLIFYWTTLDQFTLCNITRSGKMKVPEWVDLVKTNNRLVFKLCSFLDFNNLVFLGRSLPPMTRIGSTSALPPWPATCTSGSTSCYAILPLVPLIEAKLSCVFCWVIMWATVFSPNGPGLVIIVPLWTTQGENNIFDKKKTCPSVSINELLLQITNLVFFQVTHWCLYC